MTVILLVTNVISFLSEHDFTWPSVSRDIKVLSGTVRNSRPLLLLHSLFGGMSTQPCEHDKPNTENASHSTGSHSLTLGSWELGCLHCLFLFGLVLDLRQGPRIKPSLAWCLLCSPGWPFLSSPNTGITGCVTTLDLPVTFLLDRKSRPCSSGLNSSLPFLVTQGPVHRCQA